MKYKYIRPSSPASSFPRRRESSVARRIVDSRLRGNDGAVSHTPFCSSTLTFQSESLPFRKVQQEERKAAKNARKHRFVIARCKRYILVNVERFRRPVRSRRRHSRTCRSQNSLKNPVFSRLVPRRLHGREGAKGFPGSPNKTPKAANQLIELATTALMVKICLDFVFKLRARTDFFDRPRAFPYDGATRRIHCACSQITSHFPAAFCASRLFFQ